MAVLKEGLFSLDLGVIKLSGRLEESDRQCAWELYTELSTRVAVIGKLGDNRCNDFSGEVYYESFASLYNFFQEARKIMRQFPVGAIRVKGFFRKDKRIQNHLGALIYRAIRDVLRPFLERWQAHYRHWWEASSNKELPPFERQKEYPKIGELLSDWADVRFIMRALQNELVTIYKLVDIT